jgi:hypothetical protein
LVGDLSNGQREMTGYQYFPDGTYEAQIPNPAEPEPNRLCYHEVRHGGFGEGWRWRCIFTPSLTAGHGSQFGLAGWGWRTHHPR